MQSATLCVASPALSAGGKPAEEIFGREVDLVSRRGIESSRNLLRREAILSSAEVLYAA